MTITSEHAPQPVAEVLGALRTGSVGGGPVLAAVGPDDPDGAGRAVRWAAAAASSSGGALHVVSVFHRKVATSPAEPGDAYLIDALHRQAGHVVASALAQARAEFPGVPVAGHVVSGQTVETLRALGAECSTLVVGTRRLGLLDRAIVGSVAAGLAATAPCPVVVMCAPGGHDAATAEVVVGVSNDGTAEPALDYAMAYAARTGHPVRALLAVPPALLDTGDYLQPPPFTVNWLEQIVVPYRERYPGVDLRTEVSVDYAVAALVLASQAEHLLVVARRADRRHPNLHPSSVSQRLLHHAACPVAVVPAGER